MPRDCVKITSGMRVNELRCCVKLTSDMRVIELRDCDNINGIRYER